VRKTTVVASVCLIRPAHSSIFSDHRNSTSVDDPPQYQECPGRYANNCEAENETNPSTHSIALNHRIADQVSQSTSRPKRNEAYDPANKRQPTEVDIELVDSSANSLRKIWFVVRHVDSVSSRCYWICSLDTLGLFNEIANIIICRTSRRTQRTRSTNFLKVLTTLLGVFQVVRLSVQSLRFGIGAFAVHPHRESVNIAKMVTTSQ